MSLLEARIRLDRPGHRLDVDLHVGEGVTALFGPSGAGKTTLLHCIAGLLTPDDGVVELAGETLFDSSRGVNRPSERRGLGYVFQDMRLFPHLSVRGNLRYGYRGDTDTIRESDVVELLELGELLERRPDSLSGGEARRVALGRALLASPRLLLLDEPLAGLDGARRDVVLDLLNRIRVELALPMLFVGHSLPDILQLTTQVAVIDGGRLIGQGEFHEVLGRQEVFRLADSLGLESLLPVEIVSTDPEAGLTYAQVLDPAGEAVGACTFALPPVDRPAGTRGLVGIRPEDVILARAPVHGTSAQNSLSGTVTHVTRLDDRLLITVDVGAPIRAEISARSAQTLEIVVGRPVHCLMKAFSFRWRRLGTAADS